MHIFENVRCLIFWFCPFCPSLLAHLERGLEMFCKGDVVAVTVHTRTAVNWRSGAESITYLPFLRSLCLNARSSLLSSHQLTLQRYCTFFTLMSLEITVTSHLSASNLRGGLEASAGGVRGSEPHSRHVIVVSLVSVTGRGDSRSVRDVSDVSVARERNI